MVTRRALARQASSDGKRWGVIIMMAIMVFLMVASLASVMLYAPDNYALTTYGELEFEIQESTGFYLTEFNGRPLRFNYLPLNTLAVPTDLEAINLVRTAPIFIITFDPTLDEEQLQFVDFMRYEMANVFSNIGGAVTKNSSVYPLPILGCENSSSAMPVVEIRVAASPAIRKEGDCVLLEGNLTSLVLVKDAFLYHELGIILPEDLVLLNSPYEETEIETVNEDVEVVLDAEED
ncbi:hypothetical protein GOV10_01120 [Candidatus Woesearchaeota archaeon]|nr:hypothetical protein [Candidatus Woesearchaeota archaeon]